MSTEIDSTHMFTGGCGDVLGALLSGLNPVFGANHHPASVQTARINFPWMTVRESDVQNLDIRAIPEAPVLIASPICREATPAGGRAAPRGPVKLDAFGRPVSGGKWEQTRVTMWEPVRYAETYRPQVYLWENVPEFVLCLSRDGTSRVAPMFDAWNYTWDKLGYVLTLASVNAAHVRSPDGSPPPPQSRDRVVGAFVRKDIVAENGLPDLTPTCEAICPGCGPVAAVQDWGEDPPPLRAGAYGRRRQYVYACPGCGAEAEPVTTGINSVLEHDVPGEPFALGYLRGENGKTRIQYAPSTRALVAEGLETFHGEPFLVTKRNHVHPKSLDQPIGTLSAQGGGHHYLAVPTAEMTVDSVLYRPLSLREKARCQSFPDSHLFAGEKEADVRLQIGNAVAVNVAARTARKAVEILPGPKASPGAVDLRILRAVPDGEAA